MPLSLTVTHSPLRIGVIHGHLSVPTGEHDALSAVARQMDVDVLISGHTHQLVMPSQKAGRACETDNPSYRSAALDLRLSKAKVDSLSIQGARLVRG